MPDVSPASTPDDPRAPLAAWVLRERWRFFWHVPLTAGLACCLIVFILRGRAEDPHAHLAVSRKAMTAIAPPPVDPADNAAEDYKLAKQAAKSPIASPSASLQHILNGARKVPCNWSHDYSHGAMKSLSVMNYADMRQNARTLSAHALNLASMGQHQKAAETLAAVYNVGRQLEEEKLLISGLVSIAVCSIADEDFETILAATDTTPLSIEELEFYRNALWRDRQPDERLAQLLEGEKLFGDCAIDEIACGEIDGGASSVGVTLSNPERFAIVWYSTERHSYENIMNTIIPRVRSHGIITEEYIHGLETDSQLSKYITGGNSGEMFARCQVAYRTSADKGLLVDVALAWLQFRVRHSRDPKDLYELVPEFLKAVPSSQYAPGTIHVTTLAAPAPASATSKKIAKGLPAPGVYANRKALMFYVFGLDGVDNGGMSGDDVKFKIPVLNSDKKEAP